MKFPFSLVKEFAREKGYVVLHAPDNLKKTFDWVVSTAEGANQIGDTALAVFGAEGDAPSGLSVMVVHGSFAVANPNSIVLDCGGRQPAEVAEELQVYLLKIYRWVEDMHHALEAHCDCTELLALSEPILKNYISVSDSAFFHIAHTPGIEPIDDASRYLLEHGRYSVETIETVGKSGLSEFWSRARPFTTYSSNAINPRPSIDHVYHLNSQYAAHLVMICENPVTEGQEFLFSLLVGPIGTALNYLWRADNPLKKRYTSFLSEVLHREGGHHDAVRSQAEALGIPLEGVFKLCLVSEPWRASSESYFAERALTLLPGCWAVADKKDIAILLYGPEGSKKGELASLERKTFDLAHDLGTQVGVSRKFHGLLAASEALEEARIALKYGKARHLDFLAPGELPGKSTASYVYRFKRYFPFFVGDTRAYRADFSRKHDLVGQVLGAIAHDDAAHGTSDLPILRAFLRSSCRVNTTAAVLGMHRNSVSYRVKHIEKTYDLDLSDPDEVAFLTVLFTMSS